MTHTIEFDEKCKSCNGTGLYVGMAERDGASVVCHTCNGTGCHHFRYEYEEFVERQMREGVERVVQINVGIMIGKGKHFGGMSYKDWLSGKPFTTGMEMRLFACPCWWYQRVDSKKKPDWQECFDSLGRPFSRCPHYGIKDKCWARWDREFGIQASAER
jgi:hypothetical protein